MQQDEIVVEKKATQPEILCHLPLASLIKFKEKFPSIEAKSAPHTYINHSSSSCCLLAQLHCDFQIVFVVFTLVFRFEIITCKYESLAVFMLIFVIVFVTWCE
jgi:hypothetical protein